MFGALYRILFRHPRKNEQKLLAAIAAVYIAAARMPFHQFAKNAQHLVASKMSIAVIDCLEVVEISHDDADRMSFPLRQNQFAGESFFEVTAVVEAGEGVVRRLFA